MTFSQWLRENAEHYLLCEAQDKMARRTGMNPPNKPRSMKDRFWRKLVIPVYHLMPWGMKKWFMDAIPGSHKKNWPRKNFRFRQ